MAKRRFEVYLDSVRKISTPLGIAWSCLDADKREVIFWREDGECRACFYDSVGPSGDMRWFTGADITNTIILFEKAEKALN